MGALPRLPFAATFFPTEDEWADPCAYISAIAPLGAKTGICKIVPPLGWNPPSSIASRLSSSQKYKTRLQSIHALSQGEPYPDGNTYTFAEFRAMADSFKKTNFPELLLAAETEAEAESGFSSSSASSASSVSAVAGSEEASGSPAKRRKVGESSERSNTSEGNEAEVEKVGGFTIHRDGAVVGDEENDPRVALEKHRRAVFHRMTADSATDSDVLTPASRRAKAIEACYWSIVEKGGCKATPGNEGLEALAMSGAWGEGVPAPPVLTAGLRRVLVEYANDNDSKEVGSGFPRLGDRLWERLVAGVVEEVKANAKAEAEAEAGEKSKEPSDFLATVAGLKEPSSASDEASASATSTTIDLLHESPPPAVVDPRGRWSDPSYYLETPWNLNNLPFIRPSLLSNLQEEINGVNVPWLYLGMLFGSFAWHNEDHHLFSINYMHHTGTGTGAGSTVDAAKTWYGVPGAATAEFEKVLTDVIVKAAAAAAANNAGKGHSSGDDGDESDDVRASSGDEEDGGGQEESDTVDALFQITTMVSPAVAMRHGVPLYRLLQEPGEFVVTFPSAYHGGFSHGFNVAEACNFALPDWLPWGRSAVEKYRYAASIGSIRSLCFSHEQLLCNLARHVQDHTAHYYERHDDKKGTRSLLDSTSTSFSSPLAAASRALQVIAEELTILINGEESQRSGLLTPTPSSPAVAQQLHLTNESDPRHECVVCKQICYVSACVCKACAASTSGSAGGGGGAGAGGGGGLKRAVSCLRHASALCAQHDKSQKLVVYWYSIEDLKALLANVRREQSRAKAAMEVEAKAKASASAMTTAGAAAAEEVAEA